MKAEIKVAGWRGREPGLAQVSGKLPAGGEQIEILDSPSGWAATADADGKFTLPDVMWYPGAHYELIVTANVYNVRYIKITAPETISAERKIDIGELNTEAGSQINTMNLPGQNSITYLRYDEGNTDYYRESCEKMTAGKLSNEEKILSLNARVGKKLKYEEIGWNYDSARPILERGSRYCGHLSFAMAAIAEAGNYNTRLINLSDGANAHTVVEIFYDDTWHLFDPTLGLFFKNKNGVIASYKELRLDPGLIKQTVMERKNGEGEELLSWLPNVYASGVYHCYYFKKPESFCALWWPFKSGNNVQGNFTLAPFNLAAKKYVSDSGNVNETPIRGEDFTACKQCDLAAEYALKRHLPERQLDGMLAQAISSKLN